jgi:hypothetical protein
MKFFNAIKLLFLISNLLLIVLVVIDQFSPLGDYLNSIENIMFGISLASFIIGVFSFKRRYGKALLFTSLPSIIFLLLILKCVGPTIVGGTSSGLCKVIENL